MNEIIVKGVRLGGKEAVDLTIGELTWGDEEEVTREVAKQVINAGTTAKETQYDLIRMQRLKLLRSIKNIKATEQMISLTPRKDLLRVNQAYQKLNELGEAEKSSPAQQSLEQ